MKIHEYQAKAILKKYGVAVPRGEMAETREQAEAAAKKLFDSGASGVVVKAQIHAGGRGKGRFKEPSAGDKGGVRLARSIDEVKTFAGMDLALHHPKRPGELPGGLCGLRRREGGKAVGDGRAEGAQHRLRLIFMDIHGDGDLEKERTPAASAGASENVSGRARD